MRNGTLSNAEQQRYLVVWEHLIADLPDEQAKRNFRVFDRAGARSRALRQWATNVVSTRALNDLAMRRGYPVDIVSMLDSRYESKLKARLRGEQLPVSSVTCYTETELDNFARLSPVVVGVIHPFADRPFLFGGKGVIARPGDAWQL